MHEFFTVQNTEQGPLKVSALRLNGINLSPFSHLLAELPDPDSPMRLTAEWQQCLRIFLPSKQEKAGG